MNESDKSKTYFNTQKNISWSQDVKNNEVSSWWFQAFMSC